MESLRRFVKEFYFAPQESPCGASSAQVSCKGRSWGRVTQPSRQPHSRKCCVISNMQCLPKPSLMLNWQYADRVVASLKCLLKTTGRDSWWFLIVNCGVFSISIAEESLAFYAFAINCTVCGSYLVNCWQEGI